MPNSTPEVVVYTSQDMVYSEPILRAFQKETGIRVRAVYDSEAVKTVGLTQRLLAERRHPICDVFWNNEELRTRQLEARGVFRETNAWAAFGYRSRRLTLKTNAVVLDAAPRRFTDLTNEMWRGRVALAYPLFGTTATHFLALRQHLGPDWEFWCSALAQNRPYLEEGNSQVAARLARGEAWIGWTDSDDLLAAKREGLWSGPILPWNPETLLIPNTVAVIRNAPHPQAAQQLFEFLQRDDIVQRLVDANALEGARLPPDHPPLLTPDWTAVLNDLDTATDVLSRIFLRP